MFTGIVAAVGRIEQVSPLGDGVSDGVRLRVWPGDMRIDDVAEGDSIAIQGACMTVVQRAPDLLFFDVSAESLARTTGLSAPGEVNLEKALRLADRLGGHLVSGHVDGLGEVLVYEPVGESWRLDVLAPADLGPLLARKGSVAVDGVSLTTNTVHDTRDGTVFSVNLIPHTVRATTLKRLAPGMRVNLEIDLIARYCERLLASPHRVAGADGGTGPARRS